MIKIICHRGLWKNKSQQNTLSAIKRALDKYDGVEIDLRTHKSEIVLSHDIPTHGKLASLADVIELRKKYKAPKILALNVKQDGLTTNISAHVRKNLQSCFFFDLSGPEAIHYIKQNLPVYNRYSEWETPSLDHPHCAGRVLDSFFQGSEKKILATYLSDKKVNTMIISPELHGRPHLFFWKHLRAKLKKNKFLNVSICTDYPAEAKKFFNE